MDKFVLYWLTIKKPFRKHAGTSKDNIKIMINDVVFIHLCYDRDRWLSVMDEVINIWATLNTEEFLNWVTISLWRRNLLHVAGYLFKTAICSTQWEGMLEVSTRGKLLAVKWRLKWLITYNPSRFSVLLSAYHFARLWKLTSGLSCQKLALAFGGVWSKRSTRHCTQSLLSQVFQINSAVTCLGQFIPH